MRDTDQMYEDTNFENVSYAEQYTTKDPCARAPRVE